MTLAQRKSSTEFSSPANAQSIRLATPDDAEPCLALHESVFGVRLSTEEWRWKYFQRPGRFPQPFAAIGERGTNCWAVFMLPRTFVLAEQEFPAVVVVDNAIRVAARNTGFNANSSAMPSVSAAASSVWFWFSKRACLPVGLRRLSYRRIATLCAFEKQLRLGKRSFGELKVAAGAETTVEPIQYCEAEFTSFFAALSQTSRSRVLIGQHNQDWLNWRFHRHPSRPYRMLALQGGSLPGLCRAQLTQGANRNRRSFA